MRRRVAILSIIVSFLVLLVAPTLGCSTLGGSAVPATDPPSSAARSAEQHLADLQTLLRDAMHTVAPQAISRKPEQPVRFDCEAPYEGQSYYTWNLAFDVPNGERGDTVVSGLAEFFTRHGFNVVTDPDMEGAVEVRGSKDGVGFALSGAHHTSKASIEGASACGSPEARPSFRPPPAIVSHVGEG